MLERPHISDLILVRYDKCKIKRKALETFILMWQCCALYLCDHWNCCDAKGLTSPGVPRLKGKIVCVCVSIYAVTLDRKALCISLLFIRNEEEAKEDEDKEKVAEKEKRKKNPSLTKAREALPYVTWPSSFSMPSLSTHIFIFCIQPQEPSYC